MKESILHYVWQHRLFTAHNLRTTDGEQVEVIDVGRYNTDAGPDFFNSKIKIGDTLWAGNVEIHTNSTDWAKHNHQADKAYDSVILHVVQRADGEVCRSSGEKIPQLELVCPPGILAGYEKLFSEQKWIACADRIREVSPIFIQSWKNALLTERLEQKMEAVQQLLAAGNRHWEEAFYITLARNFGFATNSQAFENLARSLPLNALGKHKDQLLQVEALLFGQAGLLPDMAEDEYVASLKQEYALLRAKFSLRPLEPAQWKLLRLRPDNFPHVRIAQFAALIHASSKLFSKIVENPEMEALRHLFVCEPSHYWRIHYLFGPQSAEKTKKLGVQSVNGILINTVIPFLFCYAHQKNIQNLKDKALELLEQIPGERNAIISGWNNLGLVTETAYDSQALLQLKKKYCDERKCLRCRIGHKVLTLPVAGKV